MADNVDVLKEAYEAFGEEDLDKVLESFDDEATWQGSDSTELPGGGEHTGKESIQEVLQSIAGAWDELALTFDEFYENDDNVVVLAHMDVKKGEDSAQIPVVHVVRFEDGKIVRFQALTDTLQAAQSLGLIAGNPPSEDEDSGDDEKDSDEKDSDDKDSDSDEKGSDDGDDDDEKSKDDDDEKSKDDDDEKSKDDDDEKSKDDS
jgi:ketosteroid isomerase-like protein